MVKLAVSVSNGGLSKVFEKGRLPEFTGSGSDVPDSQSQQGRRLQREEFLSDSGTSGQGRSRVA